VCHLFSLNEFIRILIMTQHKLKGINLLNNSLLNKGTAFNKAERDKYELHGLLPSVIEGEEQQVSRIKMQLSHMETNLQKFIYLAALQDTNETLYYRILMSDPTKYLPIVYDPTVGEACLKFGHIIRKPRGIYLSLEDKGNIKNILKKWPNPDVLFIVVTDGGRILGLGDLGVNGMGIPIGKLALYTAIGGVPPKHQLPICLDVGTDTPTYLNDPLYLGRRKPRINGKEYTEFVDEFVDAVKEVYPKCCIQFEDFANYNAIALLERYRNNTCMFNDDIQGTASVTVAAFYAAKNYNNMNIKDHRILFLGAGSAAHGIANLLVYAMQEEGLSEKEARKRCWMFDTKGLVVKGRERLEDFKAIYAHDHKKSMSFLECIKSIKPTAIVGVSTTPGLFTTEVIQAMAEINDRPLILPLSNPTSQEECTAFNAYSHSKGKALFAAGVQFDEVTLDNKILYPAQANNLWIFPAVGMAVLATEATRVTEEMFLVAAKSLASQLTEQQIKQGMLFPPQSNIIDISVKIAAAVAEIIFNRGLARIERPKNDSHIILLIKEKCYHPFYESM
jgi:malate dehydrogenase (oxaloacetate-decarboxylating)(NADP+)